jgi:NAD(P) transhydrogenase
VHAFDLGYKTRLGHLLPYGLYTIPEVSFVGLTEAEAAQQAETEPFVVGRARLGDTTRGKIQGLRGGLLKLIVARRTRALLGVHVVGDSAAELVHLGQALMTTGGTVDTLIELVFNHPTLSEAYKYAAYDALGALALDARPADVRGP